jgi:flagellar export protein FliJ
VPKFVFQLDPALRARAAAEKQAMASLASVERERLTLEDSLRTIQHTIDDLRASQRRSLGLESDLEGSQGANMRGAALEAAMVSKLQLRAQQLVVQLAGVHARVGRARELLRKAAADRKSVEQMRELRLEEWKHVQNRIESARLDDISQIRFQHAEEDIATPTEHRA